MLCQKKRGSKGSLWYRYKGCIADEEEEKEAMCLSLKVIDPALKFIVYSILLFEHEYGAFGHKYRKLIFSIAMGELISIVQWMLQFFMHDKSILGPDNRVHTGID